MSNMVDINDDATIPFAPVIDGIFLPSDPEVLLTEGNFNRVNLMAGHTSHEAMLLAMKVLAILQEQDAVTEPHLNAQIFDTLLSIGKTRQFLIDPIKRQAMELVYLDDEVLSRTGGNYLDMFLQLNGDFWYVCPTDAFLKAFSGGDKSHGFSRYMYHMTHHPSSSIFNTPWSGACHTDDLIFVFGAHFNPDSPFSLTEEETEMSVQIMKYWSNFAKTG